MRIFDLEIGENSFPLFVAEISCNHCGDLNNVFKLMEDAKRSYADAVKIQVYTPDELTINSDKADFLIKKGLWKGQNLYDLYSHTQTPPDYVRPIFEYAAHIGLRVFASCFGMQSLEVLEKNNCKTYKISSFEFNDTSLVDAVVSTKKPVIFSTGLSDDNEIDALYQKLKLNAFVDFDYMFMHCVSKYPCKLEDAGLYRIKRFIDKYGAAHVGYSDHTKGNTAPGMAAALGAKIIEKHFYNPKYGESEDKAFSMSPSSFKKMVMHTRNMFNACIEKPLRGTEAAHQFKRSLYAVKPIKKGQYFTDKNVRSIRPSYGLEPYLLKDILLSKAKENIEAGTPLNGSMIEWK